MPPPPPPLIDRAAPLNPLRHPPPPKPLPRFSQTEDGLVHLQWHVRPDDGSSSNDDPSSAAAPPEHDVVVFPGEALFEPLAKGPPRVWALKFAAEKDRNLFFWMQEPDAGAGDAARGARVDALINAPMAADEGGGGAMEGVEGEDAAAAAGGEDPWLTPADALARAHESGAPGAGTEYVAGDSVGLMAQGPGQRAPVVDSGLGGGGGGGGGGGDAAAALAALLSGIGGSAGVGSGGGGARGAASGDPGNALAQALAAALARSGGAAGVGGGGGPPVDPGPSLLDVLRPDAVAAALSEGGSDALAQAAERLAEFLPEGEGQRGAQGLIDNVRSPQFRAQVAALAHALQSGQIDLATFGLAGAQGYSMRDFVEALEALVKREGKGGGGGGGGGGEDKPPPAG
jgi:hypothetical protein